MLVVGGLQGQSPDSSGDGMLKGAFRFRQVAVVNIDQNANPTEIAAVYGVITFDGSGHYSVTGAYVDNTVSNGSPQSLNITGTYVIGSNGSGYIANPLLPTDNTNLIYGAVAQGVFLGSATEGSLNDVLIAIPAGSPPTNSSFNVPYWAGVLDFAGANSKAIKNALFKLSPNGSGGFGTITFQGQASNQSASSITQTTSGATYSFQSDGSANLNFPVPSGVSSANALVAGARTMFLSADGNFILGYTQSGYDIFFGVKALTSSASTSLYQGLYFLGGLEDTPQGAGVDSFYGSANSDGAGNQIFHQRIDSPYYSPFDYGTDNYTTLNADGTTPIDFNGYQYAFGAGGQAFVGIGTSGTYTIIAGLHSPNFTGSGVFLNPIGIANAASYAPITASLAPGEMLALFGTGLSPTTLNAPGGQSLPTILGGVQVLINNIQAPLVYVSQYQISAVVPFGVSSASLASIQVNNNGTLSNTVTVYLSDSAPGAFTQNSSGIGFAVALHPDYSLITSSHPAQRGEVISIYLTGLGSVTPPVQDGALGPSNPLSNSDLNTQNLLAVFFNDYTNNQLGAQGTIQYAGLAPGYAGLYQINVQIPNSVGPGNVYFEISTDTADINQVQIPVGTTSAAATTRQSRARTEPRRPRGTARISRRLDVIR